MVFLSLNDATNRENNEKGGTVGEKFNMAYTSGKGWVIKSFREETIATRNILIKLILYPVIDFKK